MGGKENTHKFHLYIVLVNYKLIHSDVREELSGGIQKGGQKAYKEHKQNCGNDKYVFIFL